MQRLRAQRVRVNKQRLTEIFRNPFYSGLIAHSLLGDEVAEGCHPALVSRDLFLRVNGVQARNPQGY